MDELPEVPTDNTTWPLPGRCETEEECNKKSQEKLLKCNQNYKKVGKQFLCEKYWKGYNTHCYGKLVPPDCYETERDSVVTCQ